MSKRRKRRPVGPVATASQQVVSSNSSPKQTAEPLADKPSSPVTKDWKEEELIDKAMQEGSKLFVEGYKLLVTISSGSIVVMATFLEKIFHDAQSKDDIKISVAGFLVCIVTTVILTMIVAQMVLARKNMRVAYTAIHARVLASLSSIGFFTGVIFLGKFIITNL